MGAIDEGLGQIDLAALTQVFRERLENLPEHALRYPFLHAAVTRLVRRVLTRQRFPRSSGPEDPEHSVENTSRFDPRTTFAVLANFGLWDQRLDDTPLLVSELHVLLDHIRDPNAIALDHVLKNRSNSGYLPVQFLRCVLGRLDERHVVHVRRVAREIAVVHAAEPQLHDALAAQHHVEVEQRLAQRVLHA